MRLGKPYSPHIFYVCCISVADPESEPGLKSSAASDVFVCEQAVDSTAAESAATSLLPDESGRLLRIQHGREAVGVDPSVVYNDWGKGMKLLFVACFSVPWLEFF